MESGADPSVALTEVISENSIPTLEFLVDKCGADVNHHSHPFLEALARGTQETVNFFLSRGGNLWI